MEGHIPRPGGSLDYVAMHLCRRTGLLAGVESQTESKVKPH